MSCIIFWTLLSKPVHYGQLHVTVAVLCFISTACSRCGNVRCMGMHKSKHIKSYIFAILVVGNNAFLNSWQNTVNKRKDLTPEKIRVSL